MSHKFVLHKYYHAMFVVHATFNNRPVLTDSHNSRAEKCMHLVANNIYAWNVFSDLLLLYLTSMYNHCAFIGNCIFIVCRFLFHLSGGAGLTRLTQRKVLDAKRLTCGYHWAVVRTVGDNE